MTSEVVFPFSTVGGPSKALASATYNVLPPEATPRRPIPGLFDAGASTELLRKVPVVNWYQCGETEAEYSTYITPKRLALSVVSFVIFLILGPIVFFYGYADSWMGAVNLSAAGTLLTVAIANYLLCVRVPVTRQTTAQHNYLTVIMLFALTAPAVTRYPLIAYFCTADKMDCARIYIDPYHVALTLLPLTTLSNRWFIAAPFVALYLVALGAFRTLAPVDTSTEFGLSMMVAGTVTLFSLIALYFQDLQSRDLFEVWVGLRRSTAELNVRRDALSTTLRNLLPPGVLSNFKADRPLTESSVQCCILAFQVFDFERWTWAIMPRAVGKLAAAIITLFDESLKRFAVDKVRSAGDQYVVSAGLRTQQPLNDSVTSMLQMAFYQRRRIPHLATVLALPKFRTQFGVASGSCNAGYVGVSSLWYEAFGEALDNALSLVRRCPAGAILVDECTKSHDLQVTAGSRGPSYLVADTQFTKDIGSNYSGRTASPTSLELPGGCESAGMESDAAGHNLSSDLDSVGKKGAVGESDSEVREVFQSRFDFLCSRVQRTAAAHRSLEHSGIFGKGDGTSSPAPKDTIFDDERLNELRMALTKYDRRWWNVKFEGDQLNVPLTQYRASQHRREGGLASLFACVFTSVLVAAAVASDSWNIASVACLAVACGVSGGRFVVLLYFREWRVPHYEPVLSYLLTCGAIAAGLWVLPEMTLLTSSHDYFFTVTATIGLLWLRAVRWYEFVPCLLCCASVAFAMEYHIRVLKSSALFFTAPLWSLKLIIIAFLHEKSVRLQFATAIDTNATARAAKTELELQATLLDMVVPQFATAAVADRCLYNQQGTLEVLTQAEDMCCMLLRFDDLVESRLRTTPNVDSALQQIERQFAKLDDAVQRVFDERNSKYCLNSRCYKLRTSGDMALVVGPLDVAQRSRVEPDVPSAAPILSDYEHCHAAALTFLDIAAKMQAQCACTVVLVRGSGIVAVVGDAPPSVDLFGPATRMANAIMEACPAAAAAHGPSHPRMVYMSSTFVRILRDFGTVLPRCPGDLETVVTQQWRMRAAGVQMIQCARLPLQDDVGLRASGGNSGFH